MSGLWHSQAFGHSGANKLAQYFSTYERHFGRFVNLSPRILEIGVDAGNSLLMWQAYFGPNATIVGIDINPGCRMIGRLRGNIWVRIGDQGDTAFLKQVVDEFGPFDIIVDDGGHDQGKVHQSFTFLWPHLDHNGVYLVEDTHAGYANGKPTDPSFNEIAKGFVEDLNVAQGNPPTTVTQFQRELLSVHFYESLVVLEKGRPLHNNIVPS